MPWSPWPQPQGWRVPLSSSKSNRWAGQGGRRPRGLNTRGRACFPGHPALILRASGSRLASDPDRPEVSGGRPRPARWPGPSTPQDAQAKQCCRLPLGPTTLRGGHGNSNPGFAGARPSHHRAGGAPCTTAGGGEPRKQACSMPGAPADQAQLAVGFTELSEQPTPAIQLESSMDPSCPVIGNVHLSMSLPGVRMGPGDPGIQW